MITAAVILQLCNICHISMSLVDETVLQSTDVITCNLPCYIIFRSIDINFIETNSTLNARF